MLRIPLLLALLLSASSLYADLNLDVSYTSARRPGDIAVLRTTVANFDLAPRHNVRLTVPLPAEATVVKIEQTNPNWTCAEVTGAVLCSTPVLQPNESQIVTIQFRTPARSAGGRHPIRITVTHDESVPTSPVSRVVEVQFDRTFFVTSTNDEGEGTLRQAILDTNAQCLGTSEFACHVAFDLAPLSAIEPRTPLPKITACFTRFDAGEEPSIEVRGARLTRGSAFELEACNQHLAGFVIDRFPENGVFVSAGSRSVQLTASHVHSNALRGVAFVAPEATLLVRDSVISGNARSGIFALASRGVHVFESTFEANGASGIFVNAGELRVQTSTITRHPHVGIAVQPFVQARVDSTSIFANGAGAIDYGLDGRTPNDDAETDGVPNAPRITEAFYDAAQNATIVRGVQHGRPFLQYVRVAVYANRVSAEMERFAGAGGGTGGTFEVRIPGDLRGEIVTAVNEFAQFPDILVWHVSEPSEGVVVR